MSDPAPAPRPLAPVPSAGEPRIDALRRLLAILDRLRAPDGCPWDLKQTVASLAPSVIEEAHELVEAIESGDDGAAAGEAGDVLMALLLICRVAEDEGRFDAAVAAGGGGSACPPPRPPRRRRRSGPRPRPRGRSGAAP